MIQNPWINLPSSADFVLKDDEPYVEAYNRCSRAKHEVHHINLQHTPEPRLGPISAPVYILQLNPSYQPGKPPTAVELAEELKSIKCEHYPHLGVTRPNNNWWEPRLKELMDQVDSSAKLQNCICSVEFFPYRSLKFSHGSIRLPSQEYTFQLVREAIRDGKLFIVTRNLCLWEGAVPELLAAKKAGQVIVLSSCQSSYFTENNMGTANFNKVLHAIRHCPFDESLNRPMCRLCRINCEKGEFVCR